MKAASLLLPAWPAMAQFSPLRYEDDVIAQRRLCASTDFCLKDQPLGETLFQSVGGDLRLRYEYTGHPRYGLDVQDRHGVLMQRGSAFIDLRVDPHFRAFAQLSSSNTQGRANGSTPVDENRLDPTNLFLEWGAPTEGARLGLRVGIQELQFGSGRAIDAREGPNVRRSFDAVRASFTDGQWQVDAFAAAPRQNRQGQFDDVRSPTQSLHGLYATRHARITSWDVYLLHLEDTAARYVQGTGVERRWSLGTRLFGARAGWDWNWEAVAQGGHFGDARIQAWSVATDTGYTFAGVPGQPRAALLLAVATGDKNPDDHRLGTLNPLYPRGNYFGDEATLGPRNFFNVQPALTMKLSPALRLNASVDFFWRYSARDGVYAPNGALIRSAGDNRARYVATIASLGSTWTLAPGWSATAVVARSQPGAFLQHSGAAETLSFVSLGLQYRF